MLTQSTRRRLQKLEQIPCVWEGDRRSLSVASDADSAEQTGECVLWVDGSQGFVRAMDMVTSDVGFEAIVRTLIRAMEHPHNPAEPARPQKIVVKDRELLFFLRGVLQGLDIALDYAPDLPLIDEIFQGLQSTVKARPPHLPPQYETPLNDIAHALWDNAPWDYLGDHQIIAVSLDRWGIETFYVSVLGMLGLDYGILMYRSLESLKKFRASVLQNDSIEQLENAFLNQDCLFLTYDSLEEFDSDDFDLYDLPWPEIDSQFGNLHPLEGLRSFLYEEEAVPVLVALTALDRFFSKHHYKLDDDRFPKIESTYKISIPPEIGVPEKSVSVTVATMPELASELFEMASDTDNDDSFALEDLPEGLDPTMFAGLPLLREDLIPDGSLLTLGSISENTIEILRMTAQYYTRDEDAPQEMSGLPVVIVQTTRPKVKDTAARIEEAGGIRAMCFNPGENPASGEQFDLGILQLGNGQLYLFGEYSHDNPHYQEVRKKWEKNSRRNQGYCGLILAMGATGSHRGNPQLRDMMAFYEIPAIDPDDLGLGPLQMIPMF
ncbi:hypothetical protein CKA32_001035 [Geitlerinema sp. FC II]|nr:hypothetical protein [Geitlerinema sp. CS-897]PPT10143.1 hypothetical protein CKA32_001035 [Geitlerinema sp. FC II]